jgi:hypothetical protein
LITKIITGYIFILLLPLSSPSLSTENPNSIYFDDYENQISNRTITRTYPVWENGANLKVFLETENVFSGQKALGIQIISANPSNGSFHGSIYHSIPGMYNSWENGSAVRFWISNPSDNPIPVTFNFKEKFREYWSVADSGLFYLQNNNVITQRNISYSNLLIPGGFTGHVIIPFKSFAVPTWNTGQTNNIMDLGNIESYAFGVTVDQTSPRTIYLDDFEVMGETEFFNLEIQGVNHIQIPASGQHVEQYNTTLAELGEPGAEFVDVEWSILDPPDPAAQIDSKGSLIIPADSSSGDVVLIAKYKEENLILSAQYVVTLLGKTSSDAVNPSAAEETTPGAIQKSSYDDFSARFDQWTTNNRSLFVVISVMVIVVFLFLLSTIQQKLK